MAKLYALSQIFCDPCLWCWDIGHWTVWHGVSTSGLIELSIISMLWRMSLSPYKDMENCQWISLCSLKLYTGFLVETPHSDVHQSSSLVCLTSAYLNPLWQDPCVWWSVNVVYKKLSKKQHLFLLNWMQWITISHPA